MSPEQIETAGAAIEQSLAELRRAESAVAALASARAFDHVALYAQAAAHRAAYRHTGRFTSPGLEGALLGAAEAIGSRDEAPWRGLGEHGPRHVLHVATETPFPEGGHSRVIDRWIRSDAARSHSLVLTSPRTEAPSYLTASIAASGGRLHRLAPGSSSFVRRAEALRALARGFDAVVLHPTPYDAVVTMALATPARPPSIANTHTGHLFWIGRLVADVVASGRPTAIEICQERRGIAADACTLLPVPAEAPPGGARRAVARDAERASARARLAVGESDLVILTVASTYKFGPVAPYALPGILAPEIAGRPRITWLVVGPPPDGPWEEIARAGGGRIRCLGPRADLADFHAAADAYLDSYPFTSQTSLLDAAAAGLPVMAARLHPRPAAILGAWGGALDSAILGFDGRPSLGRLLDDLTRAGVREAAGQRARDAVARNLTGARWGAGLDAIYRLAAERTVKRDARGAAPHSMDESPLAPDALDDLDRYLALIHAGGEPTRAFLNWQRDITNHGAREAFPAEEAWLADAPGLAGIVGELKLIIRDFEARDRGRVDARR